MCNAASGLIVTLYYVQCCTGNGVSIVSDFEKSNRLLTETHFDIL